MVTIKGAGVQSVYFKQEFKDTSMTRTTFMFRKTTLALLAALGVASVANATPILVTMTTTPNIGGTGNYALDFFYSATQNASAATSSEFTNYNLDVQSVTGNDLLDPVKATTQSLGGADVDTWMNTVYSLLGFGNASYQFNNYKPVGIGSNNPPTNRINWDVFDTGTGDTNDTGAGPPAPYKLARIIVAPGSTGTAKFSAFDSTSNGVPTIFTFPYAAVAVPEPATLSLIGLAIVGGLGFRRRKA